MGKAKEVEVVLPSVTTSYDEAHKVLPGTYDGPRLDDIRSEQEEAYRRFREEAINAAAEDAAEKARLAEEAEDESEEEEVTSEDLEAEDSEEEASEEDLAELDEEELAKLEAANNA